MEMWLSRFGEAFGYDWKERLLLRLPILFFPILSLLLIVIS